MRVEKRICDQCGMEMKLEDGSVIWFWSGQYSGPGAGSLRSKYDEVDLCARCVTALAQSLVRRLTKDAQKRLLKKTSGRSVGGDAGILRLLSLRQFRSPEERPG